MNSKQRRKNLSNYACDFKDKSPGSINQKGSCKHSGSKQPWHCYRCNEQLATSKLFESRCEKVHGIEQFIYCCKCGHSSNIPKSTGTHMRYCQGIPLIEHQFKFRFELCKFSSKTKNGSQVHISISHKSLHNEKLQQKEKKFKWLERESEYLARAIIELKKNKVRNVNKLRERNWVEQDKLFKRSGLEQIENELKEK